MLSIRLVRRALAPMLMLITAVLTAPAFAGERLTNADIVKLVRADVAAATIELAINASEPAFDTSTDALIALRNAGVADAIVQAMQRTAQRGTVAASAATATSGNALNPEAPVLDDGGQEKPLRYLTATTRNAARGFGLGGVASDAVLNGRHADLRVGDRTPTFIVSVPEHGQPASFITLASFGARGNGTREVMIGGGVRTYSTGIHPDRIVAIDSERLADQRRAAPGFVLYRLTPRAALGAGEYALVFASQATPHAIGFFALASGDTFFDFSLEG